MIERLRQPLLRVSLATSLALGMFACSHRAEPQPNEALRAAASTLSAPQLEALSVTQDFEFDTAAHNHFINTTGEKLDPKVLAKQVAFMEKLVETRQPDTVSIRTPNNVQTTVQRWVRPGEQTNRNFLVIPMSTRPISRFASQRVSFTYEQPRETVSVIRDKKGNSATERQVSSFRQALFTELAQAVIEAHVQNADVDKYGQLLPQVVNEGFNNGLGRSFAAACDPSEVSYETLYADYNGDVVDVRGFRAPVEIVPESVFDQIPC